MTPAQLAALDAVRRKALRMQDDARRRIAGSGLSVDLADRPIALHFHPDRIAVDGRLVVDGLREDGVYRTQFTTGISSGGLSAFPGGDRDRWEERLFDGAYQRPGCSLDERPAYGGLDLTGHPDGPCPRFGSCHLRLRPHVAERATYCAGDSHTGPGHIGVRDVFEPVLAGVLDMPVLMAALGAAVEGNGRLLDDYVEAQVHGPVVLAEDVEALVADPSFRGTQVGDGIAALADRYGIGLAFHPGFVVQAHAVPPEFRGPEVAALAVGLGEEQITAEVIGRAAQAAASDAERLQQLKYLWHVLVRFGEPFEG